MKLFNKVTIVGVGLLGGSLGLAIKKRKIAAVKISTIMYLNEILALQKRHLPPNKIKLKTGILSYHRMVFSQCGQ